MTNDLIGQVAQALWAFASRPITLENPLHETITIDLAVKLEEVLGEAPLLEALRGAMARDASLLGRVLAALSSLLPYALVLVIDQAEEIFTLVKPEEAEARRPALDMLREAALTPGDFKVIMALRTEYYGRLVDGLRRGTKDMGGIREYLLTDFDVPDLVAAITRPTSTEPIRYASEIPDEKYRFLYEQGLPEAIARGVLKPAHQSTG